MSVDRAYRARVRRVPDAPTTAATLLRVGGAVLAAPRRRLPIVAGLGAQVRGGAATSWW